MDVDHGGAPLALVEPAHPPADERHREVAQIAAAHERQVGAAHADRRDRKLLQDTAAQRPREAREVRDAVAVVMDREDAGVVAEPLLGQDVDRPRRLARDRVAGGAVADDLDAGGVLDGPLGAADVRAELPGGRGRDLAVGLAGGGQAVAGGAGLAHQAGPALGHPAEGEEGAAHAVFRAEIEQPPRVALHPRLEGAPGGPWDRPLECVDLEVILDVDRKRVQHGVASSLRMATAAGRRAATTSSSTRRAFSSHRYPRWRRLARAASPRRARAASGGMTGLRGKAAPSPPVPNSRRTPFGITTILPGGTPCSSRMPARTRVTARVTSAPAQRRRSMRRVTPRKTRPPCSAFSRASGELTSSTKGTPCRRAAARPAKVLAA